MATMADRLIEAMTNSAARQYGRERINELAHALQCAELADGAGADEEIVLACLLHDVGQVVSYRKHHRHSFQLILHAERLNLASRDRYLVALVSRYHRRVLSRDARWSYSSTRGSPSTFGCGSGGAASAAPLPRSAGCARG